MSEDSVADLFERFETALEDGDLTTATELGVRIEETRPAPSSVVSEFATAVGNGEDRKADTLLRTADRRFEEREPDEEASLQRSVHARNATDVTGAESRMLTRHSRQVASAAMRRANFLGAAGTFLHDGEKSAENREELVKTARRTQVQEETAVRATDDGRTITEGKTLPAMVGLFAMRANRLEFVTGRSATVTVTVGNVGDEPAEGVTLRTTSPDDLSVTPADADVGTVPGRERSSVELTVSSDATGTYVVSVSLTGPRVQQTTKQLRFEVLEEARTFGAAFDENDNHRIDTEEIQQALVYWANDEPVPDTGRRLSTEDARQLIVTWANDQPV